MILLVAPIGSELAVKLRDEGKEVVQATGCDTAIAIAQATPPSLIIVTHRLDVDRVRSKVSGVPVVLVVSSGDLGDVLDEVLGARA